MALKEAKGQIKKVNATSNNGESLLKLLQGPDVAGLAQRLRAYVAPINGASGPGKENTSRTELHRHAKQFAPFLVQLLKLCSAYVASAPSDSSSSNQSNGDEVFAAMEIALDGLDTLRSFLTGSPFEIEIQRCALVRRLLAWRRSSAALAQCKKNFSSLCHHFLAKESQNQESVAGSAKASAGLKRSCNKATERKGYVQKSALPLPQNVEMTSGLPTLVAGIVSDLIWCTGESGPISSENYQALLPLPQQVDPWLKVLDVGVAEKHRDTLFRGLYKCSLVIVANPDQYGIELVQKFSALALQHCASSPLWEQYAKVAYKICHSLSCHGANSILIALEVSQTAMKTIVEKSELRGLWADTDVLELVDCYARLCQTAKRSVEGWFNLCSLVHHIGQSSSLIGPAVGLHAIGLRLHGEDILGESAVPIYGDTSDSRELENLSERVDSDATCYDLLKGGAAMLERCLQQDAQKVRRKYVFRLLKSVEMIKKHSTKYVQGQWASFISSSCQKRKESDNFHSALQKVLDLWYLLVKSVSSYKDLTRDEEVVLKKSWSLASAPLVSLFRLSLISQQGVQNCVTSIIDLTTRCTLQPEELRWMMASAYNMGIQLFNNKDFDSACHPFRVAYVVAWARITVSHEQILRHPTEFDQRASTNMEMNELMLDSCIKCLTLADALKRSGKLQAGFEILGDGLLRWATIHSIMEPQPMKVPTSLVHSWVEMEHTQSCLLSKSTPRENSGLYAYLRGSNEDLHMCTMGLLLEEELSALDDLEAQGLDDIEAVKEHELQCLLENVYMVERFPVERCRLLLEKGRLARLRGHHDTTSFSEVVSILKKTLKDVVEKNVDSSKIAVVENQLAMAYCVQALCAYETNPAGQEYLESIFSALSVWKKSAEARRTWIALDAHGQACIESQTSYCGVSLLRLLISIHDLLALKGYSVVQFKVQELIVSFTSAIHMDSDHKLIAALWANTRLNHVLCPVPYPSGFFSLFSQSLGVEGNSMEFWQNCALHCPSTLLDARIQLMHQDFQSRKHDSNLSMTEAFSASFKAVEDKALSMFLSSQKSTGGVAKLAVLFHILAGQALDEGNLGVAIKYAKEALNLRLRLVNRMFQMGSKRASHLQTQNLKSQIEAAEQNRTKTGRLDVLGSVATLGWSKSARRLESDPSPWRVLGDYVESLMQVGVISEKIGAVDDAVHSFREGYTLSLAQQMPLAQAAFRSCLGEVQRKRHQWEAAESDLTLAKEVYDNLESAWVCSCCSLTGGASVSLRLGDLARRSGRLCDHSGSDGLTHTCDALSCYNSAQKSLAAALGTVKGNCDCTVCAHSCLPLEEVENVSLKEHFSKIDSTKYLKETLKSDGKNNVEVELSSRTGSLCISDSRGENLDITLNVNHSQSSLEVDLVAPFLKLKLTQSGNASSSEIEPARRRGRPKKIEASGPDSQKIVKVKVPIRRGRGRNQDALEVVEVASQVVVKSTTRGKSTGRRTATKKSKEGSEVNRIKDSKSLDSTQEMPVIGEPDAQDTNTDVTAGRKEKWSCLLRQGVPVSMEEWTANRWVRYCYQQLAQVKIQTGKYHEELGNPDKALAMYEHAWCILGVNVDLLKPATSYECACALDHWKRLFPIEEAGLLYRKSCLHLERVQRTQSRDWMNGYLPLKWLVNAFSLSTQMPPLLRKISKLLSILHVSVACGGPGLLHEADACYTSEQAAYYHQVSVGTGSRQQHLALLDSKLMGLLSETEKGPASNDSNIYIAKMQQALTVEPVDFVARGSSFRELLKGLPCSTLCCISLVHWDQAALLDTQHNHALKSDEASVWILITRCSDNFGPVTFLLPAPPLFDNTVQSSPCPYNVNNLDDLQHTVDPKIAVNSGQLRLFETSVQKIAAAFTSILEESRRSTSESAQIDTVEEKRQWWRWRSELDTRLLLLLKSMENSWLGPWKCLLVTEPASSSTLEGLRSYTEEISALLRSSCAVLCEKEARWKPHDDLIQMLLNGLESLSNDQVEEGVAALQKLAEGRCCRLIDSINKLETDVPLSRTEEVGNKSLSEIVKSFCKANLRILQVHEDTDGQLQGCMPSGAARSRRTQKQAKVVPVKENTVVERASTKTGLHDVDLVATERNPLILVLDSELQGLPWESLPVLRGFETYRMPSVGSIRALFIHRQQVSSSTSCDSPTKQALDGSNQQSDRLRQTNVPEEQSQPDLVPKEPCVDPYNTYYVLNPSGDLVKTQDAFEAWFREQRGWEGKAGQVPTVEEYVEGLQKHDLYAYLGHGSGDQYIPEKIIRRLDRCAAALLMGCSSGRFSHQGDYEPVGVPLSYLMAGCPAVIANLWDVTDGDIDRFSRFLLHKWLGIANEPDAAICTSKIPHPLSSSSAQVGRKDPGIGVRGRRSGKDCSTKSLVNQEKQLEVSTSKMLLKMGSFIGEGRDLCRLPYLIGASPVYYGVPTSLVRRAIQ